MSITKTSALLLAMTVGLAAPALAQQARGEAPSVFTVAALWTALPEKGKRFSARGPFRMDSKVQVNQSGLSPQQIRAAMSHGPWCPLKKGGSAERIPGPAKANNSGTDYRLVFSSRVLPALGAVPKGGCWAATRGVWEAPGQTDPKGQDIYLFKVESVSR